MSFKEIYHGVNSEFTGSIKMVHGIVSLTPKAH